MADEILPEISQYIDFIKEAPLAENDMKLIGLVGGSLDMLDKVSYAPYIVGLKAYEEELGVAIGPSNSRYKEFRSINFRYPIEYRIVFGEDADIDPIIYTADSGHEFHVGLKSFTYIGDPDLTGIALDCDVAGKSGEPIYNQRILLAGSKGPDIYTTGQYVLGLDLDSISDDRQRNFRLKGVLFPEIEYKAFETFTQLEGHDAGLPIIPERILLNLMQQTGETAFAVAKFLESNIERLKIRKRIKA